MNAISKRLIGLVVSGSGFEILADTTSCVIGALLKSHVFRLSFTVGSGPVASIVVALFGALILVPGIHIVRSMVS